jgi:hypothetical protein
MVKRKQGTHRLAGNFAKSLFGMAKLPRAGLDAKFFAKTAL